MIGIFVLAIGLLAFLLQPVAFLKALLVLGGITAVGLVLLA